MTIELTRQDILDLTEQAQQQGEQIYQPTELGEQYSLPQQIGRGGDCYLDLRGGLQICILSGQLWQTTKIKNQHEETFPVTAKFYLSGAFKVTAPQVPGIAAEYEESAGYNYLYHLPNMVEVEEWRAHESIQIVMLYADLDYFRALGAGDDTLPCSLHYLMQDTGRFHQSLGKMTLAMTQVLQQMLHCPYQGTAQQLYLESKALELLALQFAALEADFFAPKPSILKVRDLERVQDARDILVQRFCNPPSLMELARQVSLNECTLKRGFRYLFGTTVFGYLRDYRMEQAKHLLYHSRMNVAEIAAQVGYRSPEAFSVAFRRTFSVSPKAYQLGQRE